MKKLHRTVCLCRHTHRGVVLFISLHHARIVKSESDSSQDIQNIVAVQLKKEKERERERERDRERKGLRNRDCLVR